MFSPTAGSLNSMLMTSFYLSRTNGVDLVGVNAQRLGGFLNSLPGDFSLAAQCAQRCEHNMRRVDFEMPTQLFARIAAPEPVGPQRHKAPWHPLGDLLGNQVHIVAGGDKRAFAVFEHVLHVAGARL